MPKFPRRSPQRLLTDAKKEDRAFNMKKGHIPVRTCIGCRKRRPAGELIRFTVCGDRIVVSPGRENMPGRGCYACPNRQCLDAALKKGRLARALRRSLIEPPSKEGLLRGLEQKGLLDANVDRR